MGAAHENETAPALGRAVLPRQRPGIRGRWSLEIRHRVPRSSRSQLLGTQQDSFHGGLRARVCHACRLSGRTHQGGRPGADDAPKATIAIANGKTTMTFAGTLERGLGDPVPPDGTRYPPEVTYFFQSNLGYERSDPDLYEKKWRAKEVRLFDFLDSGRPLTISAEGKSYVVPPIKVQGWKSRFKKIC
jgi:hypothetical protein